MVNQQQISQQRYSSAQNEFIHLGKTILFQSFEVAYFTGFIPMKFIPGDLMINFDNIALTVFTLFLWVNAITIQSSHYLQVRAVEMQLNAQSLGRWEIVKNNGLRDPVGKALFLRFIFVK